MVSLVPLVVPKPRTKPAYVDPLFFPPSRHALA